MPGNSLNHYPSFYTHAGKVPISSSKKDARPIGQKDDVALSRSISLDQEDEKSKKMDKAVDFLFTLIKADIEAERSSGVHLVSEQPT